MQVVQCKLVLIQILVHTPQSVPKLRNKLLELSFFSQIQATRLFTSPAQPGTIKPRYTETCRGGQKKNPQKARNAQTIPNNLQFFSIKKPTKKPVNKHHGYESINQTFKSQQTQNHSIPTSIHGPVTTQLDSTTISSNWPQHSSTTYTTNRNRKVHTHHNDSDP